MRIGVDLDDTLSEMKAAFDLHLCKYAEGLGKKVGELVYCAVGLLINLIFTLPSISYFITGYICFMEIMSLIENCDKLGVPMPNVLKKKVNNLEKELEGEKNENR